MIGGGAKKIDGCKSEDSLSLSLSLSLILSHSLTPTTGNEAKERNEVPELN